ncbi:hypothetical protein SEA_AYOTOYA_33 [Gordonia phage Ayotoya]|nr:hypothetical protein SEA_AYOTOYA_33 [Gordonia phage Ayotoya]URP21260.1 hypothetical protein SEA_CHOP_33 [Gordonia phage Chop]UXL91308.1 hypothetical protein SEA_GRANDSLAM_33 [Gordonia phage GrandSlam]
MSPELFAAIGGLVTATGTVVAGILATRSKVKLDDIAKLQARAEALEAERDADRIAHVQETDEVRARHAVAVADRDREIETLRAWVRERDRTINKLDRLVLALRTYVARLTRRLVENDVELPAVPAGIDDD